MLITVNHRRRLFPRPDVSLRSGVTMVEILVSLAIIGVLMALLIPAVQSVREAARRTQCTSNLRQIGLALAEYSTDYGYFPEIVFDGNLGWPVALLPWLDNGNLYELIAEMPVVPVTTGEDAGQYRVDGLLCPSDLAPPSWQLSGGRRLRFYTLSYFANAGTGYARHQHFGCFNQNRTYGSSVSTDGPVRPSEITDGLSNTAAIAEALHSAGDAFDTDRLHNIFNTPVAGAPGTWDDAYDYCRNIPNSPFSFGILSTPRGHGAIWDGIRTTTH